VAFEPHKRFLSMLREHYEIGADVALEEIVQRSGASHRHFFATIKEAWNNLAEEHTEDFPTAEHLRARAMIESGYCTITDEIFDSHEDAQKAGRWIRKRSPYAVIKINGNVMRVFDAESLAMHGPNAMRKERFEQCKRDVLDWIAPLARTTRSDVEKNAGRSA
jgi:hypothetical protein